MQEKFYIIVCTLGGKKKRISLEKKKYGFECNVSFCVSGFEKLSCRFRKCVQALDKNCNNFSSNVNSAMCKQTHLHR